MICRIALCNLIHTGLRALADTRCGELERVAASDIFMRRNNDGAIRGLNKRNRPSRISPEFPQPAYSTW